MSIKVQDKIVVIDNGGQYTHLIATKIRNSINVYSEILPPDAGIKKLEAAKGIIISGSPASVYREDAPQFNTEIFETGIPILGLCYGLQLMAHHLGGEVKPGNVKEYGMAELVVSQRKGILSGLADRERIWMSHGDSVKVMPKGFEVLASTADCPYAAIGDFKRNFFGLQFHPEVDDTPKGIEILRNFAINICGCKPSWTVSNFIEESSEKLRKEAKNKNVFLLASGGVDSTVAAALLEKALGPERVYALHIDNGMMRKNESIEVEKDLRKIGFKNIFVVDASGDFYAALGSETEPEAKRKIIGKTFIDVANREALKLGLKDWLLGQGTIYPDTIESGGTKHADVIKTHHNRVDVIRKMIEEGKVIEPIRELYKAEVRELGVKLGIPKERINRHPGPGLGIRALCAKSAGAPESLEELDNQAKAVAKKFGLDALVLPIKSVGVKGDERSYEYPVAVCGDADWQTLESVSIRLTNEIKGINRAVWCIMPKSIKSMEVVAAAITEERMNLLREADCITMSELENSGLMDSVWQFPTILAPLKINGGGESIILRPVCSERAMTARFASLPADFVKTLAEKLAALKGIGAVFYDITHKPPGTIEWE